MPEPRNLHPKRTPHPIAFAVFLCLPFFNHIPDISQVVYAARTFIKLPLSFILGMAGKKDKVRAAYLAFIPIIQEGIQSSIDTRNLTHNIDSEFGDFAKP